MKNKYNKVMFITPMDPFFVGGGSISSKRFLISLSKLKCEGKINDFMIVYLEKGGVCPKSQDINAISFRKSFFSSIKARLLLKASPLEVYARRILKLIEEFKPNVIIVHFSTLGNLVEKIRKKFNKISIIQNFDNFEFELREIGIASPALKFFEKYIVKKSEKKALVNSTIITALRESEAEKIVNFYKVDKKRYIIPFTLGESKESIYEFKDKFIRNELKVLFTGSLNFIPNVEAVAFLYQVERELESICKKLGIEKIQITIAGSNPSKEILEMVKSSNHILLFSNPSKEVMNEIFRKSHLYISPVFSGPGMKTKVIEALYYGLPIVASETSLQGYEKDTKPILNKFIFSFKDGDYSTFCESFERAVSFLKVKNLNKIKKEVISFYNKKYSPKRITFLIEEVIFEALQFSKNYK